MELMCVSVALLAFITTYVRAQFPATPENVTVLNSRFGDGVYISYKEVRFDTKWEIPSLLTLTAKHLRDYTGSQILFRLCPPTTR